MDKFPTGFFEKERPNMEEYLEDIQLKYDTLNKGIDELIKKCEEALKWEPLSYLEFCEIIQDLKSLKGE